MKHKVGDTLIEVALAIGIFSMVAVSVVSVVSASTSSAQNALETTVTREEIDAQAEALRFIQSSYLAGGQANLAGNTKYSSLWEAITARAISDPNSALYEEALLYSPTTCSSLYEYDNPSNQYQNIYAQHAFVINTRNLGLSYTNATTSAQIRDLTYQIVTVADHNNIKFYPATTYPRIIYEGAADTTLLDENLSTAIDRIEGLFVIAVKDPGQTTIVSSDSGGSTKVESKSAYYDFYIRSCWFAPGSDRPSTIATVIRLYDPAVIQY